MPKWWTWILIIALAYIVIILCALTFYAPNVYLAMALTIASLVISLVILKLVYDVSREHFDTDTEPEATRIY